LSKVAYPERLYDIKLARIKEINISHLGSHKDQFEESLHSTEHKYKAVITQQAQKVPTQKKTNTNKEDELFLLNAQMHSIASRVRSFYFMAE
jgi:hypothetical protein